MMSDNISEYVTKEKNINFPPDETPVQMQSTSTVQHNDAYYHHVDVPDITQVFILGAAIIVLLFIMLVVQLIKVFTGAKKRDCIPASEIYEYFPAGKGIPSCNLLSLCVLAPVFCTPKKLAEVSRQIIVANAQEIAWTPGSSRIDGHQAENITWAISSQSPADKYDLINKTSRVSPDSGLLYEPDTVLDHRERVRLFIQIQFPHGSDWSEVLRLTDIVTEKVSSGRTAGGYHHRHTGYTWSVSVN
ncbi:TPA: hypothetical protein RLU78_003544 [Escherichia coli]|nr:hypothetical protein [Escherichia coli]HDW2612603.1 hypothetical protein [Escherichia coli]